MAKQAKQTKRGFYVLVKLPCTEASRHRPTFIAIALKFVDIVLTGSFVSPKPAVFVSTSSISRTLQLQSTSTLQTIHFCFYYLRGHNSNISDQGNPSPPELRPEASVPLLENRPELMEISEKVPGFLFILKSMYLESALSD